MTMKRIGAVLAFMCVTVSAQAVQTLELTSAPPLQPLNWCKGADGVSRGQIEPCGPGQEVGSSISVAKDPQPVASTPAPKAAAEASKAGDKETLKEGQFHLLKLFGFALIFGVVAKILGRSFFFWFVIGGVIRMVLVSLDLMKF